MAGESGATTSRLLNRMQYEIANKADTLSGATGDFVLAADIDDDYEVKKIALADIPAAAGYTATIAEVNRAADASARIVTTTATVLALTITEHAERIVIVNTNSTVANAINLPAATGSGAKFTVWNGITQTQGSIVIAANGTDVFKGFALAFDSSAVATHQSHFVATATDDKVTWNLTTTGGLSQDTFEAIDEAANTWRVKVIGRCVGAPATPFSAT